MAWVQLQQTSLYIRFSEGFQEVLGYMLSTTSVSRVVQGERLLGRVDAVGLFGESLADGYLAYPVGQSPETPGG